MIRESAKGLASLVLLLAVMCAGPAGAQQADPIRIGALIDLTGSLADFGVRFRNGIEFRLQEADYTVAGRPIKLIIADSGSLNPTIARDQAKKLVEQDKVHAVIGPLNTPARFAVEPYFAEHRVPTLTISAHSLVAKKFGWTVFTRGTVFQAAFPLGTYASEQLGVKTVATIGTDFVPARDYIGAFVEGLKQKGGTVVQQQWVPPSTPDFGPYLVNLKETDALALMISGTDMLRFIKQYAEFGLLKKRKTKILLPTLAILEESRLNELGDIIVGFIGADDYAKRGENPANRKFVASFESKMKKKSEKHEAAAYESTSILLQALEVTKGDTDPEKLRQAMFRVKMDTPSGTLSFTRAGLGVRDVHIMEARKVGNEYGWVPLKTYPHVRHPGE